MWTTTRMTSDDAVFWERYGGAGDGDLGFGRCAWSFGLACSKMYYHQYPDRIRQCVRRA
jgi:hypothetical protein